LLGLDERDGPRAARERLDELVQLSRKVEWGRGVVLEYYGSKGRSGESRKAEVLVAVSSSLDGDEDEQVYSILFLRPYTAPPAPDSTPRPALPPLPSQTDSSSSVDTVSSSITSVSTSSRRPPIGDVRGRTALTPVLENTFARLTKPLWSPPPVLSSSPAAPSTPSTLTTPSSPSSPATLHSPLEGDWQTTAYHLAQAKKDSLPPAPKNTPSMEVLFNCIDMLPNIAFISALDAQILHVNRACVLDITIDVTLLTFPSPVGTTSAERTLTSLYQNSSGYCTTTPKI
jgi:hypothetical protein